MVTSNNFPEKKVFKMSEQNNSAGAPHRTLLGEVNAHLTCYLCRGYYIDATTIVECLHSFCRSCIIKHLQAKSYCPVCEMMINSAKPNIKPDKALQDIVYKLVPGLFQKEMERRRSFYASRPGPAASATPEQRGEDTERIIFNPEDVISFSLEYADLTDTDSISSKSSDSNEQQPPTDCRRRFLQCPAVVNISHLKKFLCMKFDIDSTQYSLDILYKRIPLPEYYTLMDIAYIYNWKRNKPLRFVYQVIDYLAMRNRYSLFDMKRKNTKCHEKPPTVDDVGPDSPSLLAQEHGSEASSGTNSPMPDEAILKKCEINNKSKIGSANSEKNELSKHNEEDVEKSQFLNSFELTAKNSSSPGKSPTKSNTSEPNKDLIKMSPSKILLDTNSSNVEDNSLKRKHSSPVSSPNSKKIKTDLEKEIPEPKTNESTDIKTIDMNISKDNTSVPISAPSGNSLCIVKENLQISPSKPEEAIKPKQPENKTTSVKRPVPGAQKIQDTIKTISNQSAEKKVVSPLKIQLPKFDVPSAIQKPDALKPTIKKMPELKLGISPSRNQLKVPPTKMRMDLLANNCDPTMDRSKILPHIKSPLPTQNLSPTSGDPLKSLFDSCKINIPSSLSITLTDQKQEQRLPENVTAETPPLNKNVLSSVNMHKAPSPPVHNYIEILKLPETDTKQTPSKMEPSTQYKIANPMKKTDLTTPSKLNVSSKQSDTPSSKGPIPSLKPIGEAKLAKQISNFPVTSPYQQKYIQSLEQSKVPRINVPRVRMQVPNLMPANVKQLSAAANKESMKVAINTKCETKTSTRSDALDLSTSHSLPSQQSQLGPQQTKTLATMQAIANIANKQSMPNKGMQLNAHYSGIPNKIKTSEPPQSRIPNMNLIKTDKMKIINTLPRQDTSKSTSVRQPTSACSTLAPPVYQMNPIQNTSLNTAISSPRQVRSPSSSPKLVIAEDKHSLNTCDTNVSNNNQSNQISSTQCSVAKSDPPKPAPGPSKISLKTMKPVPGSRHPVPNSSNKIMLNTSSSDLILQPPMYPQVMLRHLEWFKTQQARQYEKLLKTMPNLKQNFNKDKQ